MTSISAMEPARRSSPAPISTCYLGQSADGWPKANSAVGPTRASAHRRRVAAIKLVAAPCRLAEHGFGDHHAHALARGRIVEHRCYVAWQLRFLPVLQPLNQTTPLRLFRRYGHGSLPCHIGLTRWSEGRSPAAPVPLALSPGCCWAAGYLRDGKKVPAPRN